VLLDKKKFEESDFLRFHQGGSLGARLKEKVSEVMLTGDRIPKVSPKTSLRKTIQVLNEKNLGAVLIVGNQHRLAGIITDGDIRRLVTASFDLEGKTAADAMIANPKTIEADLLAADALSIMQRYEITVLPVIDDDNRLQGILHLHDLIGKGEFRFLV